MKKWSIRDIIDFEYFSYRDGAADSADNQRDLNERDRRIYLDSVAPHVKEGEPPDPRFIIRTWLNRRRQEEEAQTAVLPGESFESLYGSFRILFVLAGLFLGGGAGLTFLTYTGDRPLNVFVFLTLFVFSQILLLLLLPVLAVYRARQRSTPAFSPLYKAISRFMLRILLWVRNRIAEKIGAGRRRKTEAALGLIMSRGRTYGLLFFLPVFILVQLFGVGFNLGLLAATLFKVVTADIAFGWQSTLQLSPAALHGLVQKVALPWSWLPGGAAAYPSLAQIEGSRIILKEGIYHLSTPDLASWWPFLCFSVLFYGLLPRLLLFLTAAALQQRKLRSLDFRQGNYDQLLLRMTTPLVTTSGRRLEEPVAGTAAGDYGGESLAAAAAATAGRNLFVLVPGDVYDARPTEEFESALRRRFGGVITAIVRIDEEYDTDAAILANLKKSIEAGETDILLIQEAWQPPITEYIDFIKNLRIDIGHGPCIRIVLIGKPLPATIFTPVQEGNRKIWRRRINAIGDPCIHVVEMVHNVS